VRDWVPQDRIYRNHIKNVKELRQRVEEEWARDSLDQRLIDNAIRDIESALQLTENISYMHCEHDCFALCFNAAQLLDY